VKLSALSNSCDRADRGQKGDDKRHRDRLPVHLVQRSRDSQGQSSENAEGCQRERPKWRTTAPARAGRNMSTRHVSPDHLSCGLVTLVDRRVVNTIIGVHDVDVRRPV